MRRFSSVMYQQMGEKGEDWPSLLKEYFTWKMQSWKMLSLRCSQSVFSEKTLWFLIWEKEKEEYNFDILRCSKWVVSSGSCFFSFLEIFLNYSAIAFLTSWSKGRIIGNISIYVGKPPQSMLDNNSIYWFFYISLYKFSITLLAISFIR